MVWPCCNERCCLNYRLDMLKFTHTTAIFFEEKVYFMCEVKCLRRYRLWKAIVSLKAIDKMFFVLKKEKWKDTEKLLFAFLIFTKCSSFALINPIVINFSFFFRFSWPRLWGEHRRLSWTPMSERRYLYWWCKQLHVPMSIYVHWKILRTGRRRVLSETIGMPKRRHLHQQRGRLLLHLRERLDRTGLLCEHRWLRWSSLF